MTLTCSRSKIPICHSRSNVTEQYGLPIYDFLLMFNIITWGLTELLDDIRLQNQSGLESDFLRSFKFKFDNAIQDSPYMVLGNLSDLEFDLSRLLKVKFDSAIGLPIYGFVLPGNV